MWFEIFRNKPKIMIMNGEVVKSAAAAGAADADDRRRFGASKQRRAIASYHQHYQNSINYHFALCNANRGGHKSIHGNDVRGHKHRPADSSPHQPATSCCNQPNDKFRFSTKAISLLIQIFICFNVLYIEQGSASYVPGGSSSSSSSSSLLSSVSFVSPLSSASFSPLQRIHHPPKHQHHHQHHVGAVLEKNAPEFVEEMSNLTVALGRDVIFECVVNNLGSYKLAWLKVDDGQQQQQQQQQQPLLQQPTKDNLISEPEMIAIQTNVLSDTSKYRVSHNNQRQWFLHIKQIKSTDRGYYMCQINTEPIISQAAFLDILIAPSIDYNATSSDVSVDERHRLAIRCKANGYPTPTIIWRREDNKDINLGLYGGKRYSASKVEGEYLNITQVTRDDMGAYLCIASNSVPPSVSKRIIVRVNFRPKIKVSNQLVGSSQGSDVQLECRCEASPTPATLWIRSFDGLVLSNSSKYQVYEENDSYRTKMKLKIVGLNETDFGSYKCVARNSLGEKEGLVRLYEIIGPTSSVSPWPTYIYSYQGQTKNGLPSNHTNLVLGDRSNYGDYSDYQHAAGGGGGGGAVTSISTMVGITYILLSTFLHTILA